MKNLKTVKRIIYLFIYLFIYLMYVSTLQLSSYTLEEGIRFHPDSCETRPLEKQSVFLTAEPSLQSPTIYLFKNW